MFVGALMNMKLRVGLFNAALLLSPRMAAAGMPTITLSDFARMRFQTISFFLVAILCSAWLVRTMWNSLAADFEKLPRLSYSKSVSIVLLWGLLFVIVLTMISGARELMTPGAWSKQELTYTLDDDNRDSPDKPSSANGDGHGDEQTPLQRDRLHRLEQLRSALWRYADDHGGTFSPPPGDDETDLDVWQVPGRFGTRYVYFAGKSRNEGDSILACEPDVFNGVRYVLLCNGEIEISDTSAIQRALAAEVGR